MPEITLRGPIIVRGAARSGTKMVRSLISMHLDVTAVPYDINHLWKYGNYDVPHHELRPHHLTQEAQDFIRTFLVGWRQRGARRVVEKAVSNTLRVEFVRAVLPDCQLVHIVRDGRDVAPSARSIWQAPLNWRATLCKVRRFPLRAVSSHGREYVRSYLRRSVRPDRRVNSSGPRFQRINAIAEAQPLPQTCGVQWRRSVAATPESLAALPKDER